MAAPAADFPIALLPMHIHSTKMREWSISGKLPDYSVFAAYIFVGKCLNIYKIDCSKRGHGY